MLVCSALLAKMEVGRLRCEYLEQPMCVQESTPRLSWTMTSLERGARQTAYRILVASTAEKLSRGEGDVWDSGKVISAENALVPYGGKALRSKQDCHWKVQVWDRDETEPSDWSEPSYWRMGLLGAEDWCGAQWIVHPSAPLLSANKSPHNGFHTEFLSGSDDVAWVQIELKKTSNINRIMLHPACPYDYSPKTSGFLFPVRYKIEVSDNADFSGDTTVVFDSTQEDFPNPGDKTVTHEFASVKGRFVRLTANKLDCTSDGYAFALAEMEVFEYDTLLSHAMKVTSSPSISKGGWGNYKLVDGRIESEPGSVGKPVPATRFRRQFTVAEPYSRALIAVTGLGTYELYLNGQRVGDAYLAPEWTAYDKRIFYRVYDVTDLLIAGENTLAAEVCIGWRGSPITLGYRVMGTELCLKALLEIDGKVAVVTDGSWQASDGGPVRRAEIYYGLDYDGTREQPGWNCNDYKADGWASAGVIAAPKGSEHAQLIGQPVEPIRCEAELPALSVTQPKPGVYVFDVGQNMAGVCRFHAMAERGANIRIAFGEMLNDDGTVYRANLRRAQEVFSIVWPGGERTLEPRHTYYGYRYAEVSGLDYAPVKEDFIGIATMSSAPQTGTLKTSNPLVNKLMDCIQWAQRDNMISTGTDCPQRDERLGWAGDLFSFSQTAIFNRDMGAFLTKYLHDMVDGQKDDGRYPEAAPCLDPKSDYFGSPGWADAGVYLPWLLYQNYGDIRVLERNYEAAKAWVEWVRKQCDNGIWVRNRFHDYGDWLNGDTLSLEGYPYGNCEMPKEQFATAIAAFSVKILSQMASVLGRGDDAREYSELFDLIRKSFHDKYMNTDGTFRHETQASYALALNFGLAYEGEHPMMIQRMLAAIKAYNGHVSTGFHSTHRMMLELSRNGCHAEANRLLNLRTVPSWGYMIDNGATTLWERWDGYVKGRGFQKPSMNSFNHWAFGSVGEWIWRTLAGLNPDEKAAGYRHVVIRPRPDRATATVTAGYDSIRGRFEIVSEWQDDAYHLSVLIPPNATATVYVPSSDMDSVCTDGVKPVRVEEGAAVFEVPSGRYDFSSLLK